MERVYKLTIYFVRTHHHYQPYDDWYKLATLSGFETCMENEIDIDDPSKTYIINHFAGRNLDGNRPTKAQIILWQTEYITLDRYEVDYGNDCRKHWRYWHMDAWQAEQLNHEYIPIGSHRDLGYIGISGAYKYDIALLAYASGRRQWYFQRLMEKFNIAPNCWGDERTRVLKASRLMVHIHQQDNMAAIPGIRMALAAAYGLPVLCEHPQHLGIYAGEILITSLNRMIGDAQLELKDSARLSDYGHRLNHLLCDKYSFKKVVEGAI